MNNIIYINNIKERLFNSIPQKDFDILLNTLTDSVLKNTHLWYDLKYINSCLDLFFIYFNKINKPLPLFYSFFNKNNLNISPLLKSQISFYKLNSEYLYNDLGISENDFNIYKSILIYCDFIKVNTLDKSQLFAGLSIETESGISFKFKGKPDKSKLITYVPMIIDEMTLRYENILNLEIKQLYLNKINYLVTEHKNFKIR